MKVFFRNIHLYLSLIAGVIIMITCFTGAVLVFEEELQQAFNEDRYFVKADGEKLPIETLVQNVKKQVPEAKISSVKIHADPERTVEVGYSVKDKKIGEPAKEEAKKEVKANGKEGDKGGKKPERNANRKTAFVNPYSGDVVELYSYRETFFYKMFALHRWLLGSNDGIGKYVVGVCTFIFLFILITGIILWWPKTRKILSQRITVKWTAGWKRINHDFHIVLGFYTAIFLFIFAFTGLSWSFAWFNKGVAYVTNSKLEPAEAPVSKIQADRMDISYDNAFAAVAKQVKAVEYYNIMAPKDSTGSYAINVLQAGNNMIVTDTYYVDQYSGEVVGSQKFEERNTGQKVRAGIKPVHTGAIFGMPSKIIGFIVCLLGTTFPITGTIMWINRLRRAKKKAGKRTLESESF